MRDAEVGIHAVPGLTHTVGEWAADGLLAIFFFLTGLELKASFVDGELRNPAKAAVPIVAAFGGAAVPAIIYAVLNLTAGSDPRPSRAGPSPPPRTSPSPSPCWPWWAPRCRWPCAPSF